jgi:cytoskeletal protein RodZ
MEFLLVRTKRPQASLDRDQAQIIGARLMGAREALNLPASKVANILLLSRHQIECLEVGDVSVFYNAQFYAQAADKYAAFLELTPAPSASLLAHAETVEAAPAPPADVPPVVSKIVDPQAQAAKARIVKRTLLVAVLVAVAAGAYLQRTIISDFIVAQWPAAPVATVEPAPPMQQPAPAPVVETPPPVPTIESGTVNIRFSGSSWVQVVYADGTRKDHTYKAGDTLTLEPAKLQALIIGNVKATTAETAKGVVNLNAYATGGNVARIIGPAARALVK